MNTELQTFNFQDAQLRTVAGRDGEPLFVANDVAKILGYGDATHLTRMIDSDLKGIHNVETPGGIQAMTVITEAGLYEAILKSRVEAAKPFRKWVTGEVLPAIRKHGAYMTPEKLEEALLNPDTVIRLAETLKAEREKRRLLETEAEANAPKVLFADAVAASKTSILVNQFAKILKGNGVDIGQNRLFDWLREEGYLQKAQGERWNMPTQYSMDLGLFEVKESVIHVPGKHPKTRFTPKLTGKWQQYFLDKFLTRAVVDIAA